MFFDVVLSSARISLLSALRTEQSFKSNKPKALSQRNTVMLLDIARGPGKA